MSAGSGDCSRSIRFQQQHDCHAIDANVDDLITLTGIDENTTNLGTFTGDIITDNTNIKQALQDLESELETSQAQASASATQLLRSTVTSTI